MDSRSSTVINGILDRLQRDRSFADYSQLIQANNAHSSSFIKRALHNAWYGEGSGLSNSPKEVTGLGPVPLSEPPLKGTNPFAIKTNLKNTSGLSKIPANSATKSDEGSVPGTESYSATKSKQDSLQGNSLSPVLPTRFKQNTVDVVSDPTDMPSHLDDID